MSGNIKKENGIHADIKACRDKYGFSSFLYNADQKLCKLILTLKVPKNDIC